MSEGDGRELPLERDEFNAVFAAHYIRVLRYVQRRVDDRGTAEEIAAETFLVAWSKRGQVEISVPWLYRTAANKIGDHYRRSQRKRAAEAALARRAEEAPEEVSPLDRLALTSAIDSLTEKEREVVMLTYWERLPAKQVAEVMGGSESSIWVTLTRARTKIRKHLNDSSESATGGGDHALR
jgi:RNA polymerase sigma factor (sigma-70 family)